jgi:putative DNA primase/helicase
MSKKLAVTAIIEDEATSKFSVRISFTDINGNKSSIIVARSLLNNPRRLVDELEDHGAVFRFGRNTKNISQRVCRLARNAKIISRAKDVGWQDDGSFVSFTKTYKSDASNVQAKIAPSSPYINHLVKKGDIEGWQNTVAKNARYSSSMVFSICAAFAAATLESIGLNTFGFMLVGPPKIGKSTIQLTAGTVIGFSEERHLPNFRRSEPGLEELTASFNDHVLLVNGGELVAGETSEARAQKIRAFAYRLAEGQSKGFSKTVNRPTSFYRTIFIGSMEHRSVLQQRPMQSKQASGSEVRVFDILAASKKSGDIFDRAPKYLKDSKRKKWADNIFSEIRAGAKENCGVAYRPYVMHLIERQSASQRFLKRETDRIFRKIAPTSNDAGIRHIAKDVSCVAAAGLLARKLKILPWSRKLIEASAKRCFNRAIKLLPNERAILGQAVKSLCTAFKTGALVDLRRKETSKTALDVAKGYYTGSRKHRVVTIKGQDFIDLIGSNDLAFRLLQQWDKAGLINSRNRKAKACKSVKDFESQTAWPNGKRPRSIQIQWNSKKIKKALR